MFTGIVAAVGSINSISPLGGSLDAGVRLQIDAGGLPLGDVALGDSIAINGACMTVVDKTASSFSVDVSRESLSKTVGLDAPGEVNLEKALTLAERLGGHLVSGHVDGLGQVHSFEPVGESRELVIDAPQELAKFLAYKGSIVVNGVSLTVNRVEDIAHKLIALHWPSTADTLARFGLRGNGPQAQVRACESDAAPLGATVGSAE